MSCSLEAGRNPAHCMSVCRDVQDGRLRHSSGVKKEKSRGRRASRGTYPGIFGFWIRYVVHRLLS